LAKGDIHFEVLSQKTSGWSLQRVCDGEKAAIEHARHFLKEQKLTAVKVMKITYDTKGQSYQEKEIYFEGTRVTAAAKMDVDLIEPICRSADELYRSDSRREIFNALRKPLLGWKIMPIELLYGAEHVQRLNDAGQVLQGAVQKVAISQIQKTGQKVNERVLELYGFSNEILKDLKHRRQKSDLGLEPSQNLEELHEKLKGGDDPKKDFFIALSHLFGNLKSLDEKFEKTLSYIEEYNNDDILYFLDHYLADHLNLGDNVKTLIGEEETLGDGMLSLIELIRGQSKPRADRHKTTARLCALYRENKMPASRKALVHKLTTSLESNASFHSSDLLKNMQFHRQIADRMHLGGEKYVGGLEAFDAIKSRCERLTGTSTIGRLLEDQEHPLDRIERLLEAAAGFVGAVNLRALANFIIPILESGPNRQLVISEIGKGLTTLRRLSSLQRKTRKVGFPDFFQRRILEDLDELAYEGIQKTGILNNVVTQSSDMLVAGTALLGIIFRGEMPRPKSMEEFKSFSRRTILAEKFLMSIQKSSQTSPDGKVKLQQFYKLLEDTRMDLSS